MRARGGYPLEGVPLLVQEDRKVQEEGGSVDHLEFWVAIMVYHETFTPKYTSSNPIS